MNLLIQFEAFIRQARMFGKSDHLLLAVSGGVDSVVLCELCSREGYQFTIAHCNFQLRGKESDRDEEFVRALGKKYSVAVLVKRFETEKYANDNKVSIQVAARELRYAWFREIIDGRPLTDLSAEARLNDARPNGSSGRAVGQALAKVDGGKANWIVTAHHLDDNIETVLMNFFKGTGLSGMRGILPKSGKIVRPLLFARKEQLLQFANENNLQWVEDSSNQSDKYARNYLRHQLIPIIEKLYPTAIENLADNIERFRELDQFHQEAVEHQLKKLMEWKGEEVHIPILKLKKMGSIRTILYELITKYGFAPDRVEEVIHLLDSETGKYLLSSTHRILKNRNWLIISPLNPDYQEQVVVEEGNGNITFQQGRLSIHLKEVLKEKAQGNNGTALLDAIHIRYPLLLRKWKPGDYFYPLGMKKKKKLARFFIDQKLSLAQKEKTWVIEMNRKIIWVVGMRIDDRFKITDKTTQVLEISLDQKELK